MKKLILTTTLALAIALGATAQTATNTTQDLDARYATNMLKPGTQAPDFTLKTHDGKDIKLSSYAGKYVVLDFWASWCPDCRKDIPAMKALYDEFRDQNVAFIGISFDTDKDAWVRTFWDKYQMNWTQVSELKKWKKETFIDRLYHIDWIPAMYLIDPSGKIILGTVEIEKLKAKLEEMGNRINPPEPFTMTMPEYPGGQQAMMEYLARTLTFTTNQKKMQVEMKFNISFNVEADGSVTGARIVRVNRLEAHSPKFAKLKPARQKQILNACADDYKRKAIALINEMPHWNPGTENGRPVQTKMAMPLIFKAE